MEPSPAAPPIPQPLAESPPPAPLASPAPQSVAGALPQRVGVVTHFYPNAHAAAIRIDAAELRVGDTIHVRGHTTDYYQRIRRIEREHESVTSAGPGDDVAIEVSQRVREGDVVYRLTSATG